MSRIRTSRIRTRARERVWHPDPAAEVAKETRAASRTNGGASVGSRWPSLTAGVAWALVLSTILINRSGDRTAELISLVEEGQQTRESALGQIPQSQEERRAALEAQRQQTRSFQAEAGAARASQAKEEAAARQALAGIALAQARSRQADAEAILAQAQAGRPSFETPSLTIEPPSRSISLERQQIDLQKRLNTAIEDLRKQLNAAIEDLREAIEDIRPGRPAALISL